MNIQQDESSAKYQIKHYEPGKIQINEDIYTQSVIVRQHEILTDWRPQTLADLSIEDFETILATPPAILLLGTGEKMIIPKQELLIPLFEKGIGVEYMDSKPACYTFTILSADNREVAACILII